MLYFWVALNAQINRMILRLIFSVSGKTGVTLNSSNDSIIVILIFLYFLTGEELKQVYN